MDLYKYFYNLPGNEEHRVKMIIATDTAEYIFAVDGLPVILHGNRSPSVLVT